MFMHHVSLCTTNLEEMVAFYKKYFGAVEHTVYENPKTGVQIYTLQFDKGVLLEIMTRPGCVIKPPERGTGYTHIAMSTGGRDEVDFITGRLEDDGHTIVSAPRITGEGYYESTVQDPDGNWIEINTGEIAGTVK